MLLTVSSIRINNNWNFQKKTILPLSKRHDSLKLLCRVVSGARFLTGGVFVCDIGHRRSVAVLCMLYKIRCNPTHLLYVIYQFAMCQCGLHPVHWLHIGIFMSLLAAEHRSTTWLLLPSHAGSLWSDLVNSIYSSAYDWRVLRAGPMFFNWPIFARTFYSLLCFLSLLSFYRLVLWRWRLLTDRVQITLSQPCINNNNNNKNIK